MEAYVEKSHGPGVPGQTLRMQLLDFARGGPDAKPKSKERGSILEASCQRADEANTFVLIVDPREVVCAGPHTPFTEAEKDGKLGAWDLEARHLVVHHYVELLDRDAGRCTQYHERCTTPDSSILWVANMLKAIGNGSVGLEKAAQPQLPPMAAPCAGSMLGH